ncbi:unnamed protein product [Protopolystoma xenopodis]|uniref:Uncharacterized protein n=1 Tax=Protopolystoma xenopodis TaxID=117903 RepID=A0A3S5A809_9PLAT|nr:unnamed protein product [Protopolystoma xenopodis]
MTYSLNDGVEAPQADGSQAPGGPGHLGPGGGSARKAILEAVNRVGEASHDLLRYVMQEESSGVTEEEAMALSHAVRPLSVTREGPPNEWAAGRYRGLAEEDQLYQVRLGIPRLADSAADQQSFLLPTPISIYFHLHSLNYPTLFYSSINLILFLLISYDFCSTRANFRCFFAYTGPTILAVSGRLR